jgi:hypothetical protein
MLFRTFNVPKQLVIQENAPVFVIGVSKVIHKIIDTRLLPVSVISILDSPI